MFICIFYILKIVNIRFNKLWNIVIFFFNKLYANIKSNLQVYIYLVNFFGSIVTMLKADKGGL